MNRVLLIGLDSADADLIEKWAGEGYLPNFAQLLTAQRFHRIATSSEYLHVSGWPSLYTGTNPGQHGMYHAYQVRSGVPGLLRTEPNWCAMPPFWQHLDAAGRKCIVFDAFMDHPMKSFKGIQILEYGTWTWFGEPGSTPARMLGEIRKRFGPYPAPEHANQVEVPNDPRRFRDQLIRGALQKAEITRALMTEHDLDFLFVSFGEPHGAGHYLWHFSDPQYPLQATDDTLTGQPLMREVYTAVDEAIGQLISQAGPGTTVMVTSPDGMGANYSGCQLMPALLHRMGLLHGPGLDGGSTRGPAKGGLLQALRGAIPLEFRQAVTRCLPRRYRYQLSMKWANSAVDWQRSRVYCIPNSNEAYFRANLEGREPTGIVHPGSEYEELIGELSAELHALRSADGSMSAVDRVTRIGQVCSGGRLADLPDLSVSWCSNARTTTTISSHSHGMVTGLAGYQTSPFYTGNHRPAAFVATAGAHSLVPGNGASVLDLAPTILRQLGVETPVHYEGRAW
ncbi:MAG: alkaline phosphatase family protein [Steroidobacteraceae bacterium]